MMYKIYAMRHGIEWPWYMPDKDHSVSACPDALLLVIFEVRRVRKRVASPTV